MTITSDEFFGKDLKVYNTKMTSKETMKKIWNDNKLILDLVIPKSLFQDTRYVGKEVTLREYLLDKVTVLEEKVDKNSAV